MYVAMYMYDCLWVPMDQWYPPSVCWYMQIAMALCPSIEETRWTAPAIY